MADNAAQLGQLVPDGELRRDAVHVAIAPVTAGFSLLPGEHVSLRESDGRAVLGGEPVGIVDPFLKTAVQTGQRFWLCLYPNTVTSLRHVWTHPVFEGVGRRRTAELLNQLKGGANE